MKQGWHRIGPVAMAFAVAAGCAQATTDNNRPGAVTFASASAGGSSSTGSDSPSPDSTSDSDSSDPDPSAPDPTDDSDCPVGEQGCPCGPDDSCSGTLLCAAGLCLGCSSCGACGDDVCDANETCEDCAADCGTCAGCGDGTCSGSESCSSCPADCDVCPGCGNGACDGQETCNGCEADCGACDVCTQASAGDGWYCGDALSGQPNLLYRCVSSNTVETQPCVHGCASCPAGTADVCRASVGQTDTQACAPPAECNYDTSPDGCGDQDEWCNQGNCQACSSGFANCDNTQGCECDGLCQGTTCLECDYDASPDQCGSTFQWCFQNECRSCTAGFRNCDQTQGCECEGTCDPQGNCVPS